MEIIKGKYNTATVYAKSLDEATRAQIIKFVNHSALEGNSSIKIMPDCHAGAGACIGFTMLLNNYVVPNMVGVDESCGMLATNYGKIDIDVKDLDRTVHELIPSGFSINDRENATSNKEKYLDVAKTINLQDTSRVLRSIGSLGGGNHFIEFDKDNDGNTWSIIHSGSRNFGLQIANYFHKLAVSKLSENPGKDGIGYLKLNTDGDAESYLACMRIAQIYAMENRAEMQNRIAKKMGLKIIDSIESVHNFIGDDNIIRKGATSARGGERCIIPFNSVDGTAICVGKGNAEWNFSAPHGAGRLMSRSKAKENLSVDDMQFLFKEAGIYTTTANKSTLDESPEAYKPMQEILDIIGETVNIQTMLKPFYNFKASGD